VGAGAHGSEHRGVMVWMGLTALNSGGLTALLRPECLGSHLRRDGIIGMTTKTEKKKSLVCTNVQDNYTRLIY
jgi:hypothetical protein